MRIKEGAFDAGHRQRLKRPGADRHIGEDMPHRQIDRRIGRCPNRIHRPHAGRAGAGEVKDNIRPHPPYRQRDGQGFIYHPVTVDISARCV